MTAEFNMLAKRVEWYVQDLANIKTVSPETIKVAKFYIAISNMDVKLLTFTLLKQYSTQKIKPKFGKPTKKRRFLDTRTKN